MDFVNCRYSGQARLIFNLVYLTGAVGNAAALFYLLVSKSKPKNSKHLLMLRCLAASDLVAVVGMWGQMYVLMYYPQHADSHPLCCLRTVWRIFGLGSGCIVIVMAVERWFALTRPFFYQKVILINYFEFIISYN
ncbi:hypothetical protein AAG570_008736 [Ranatra chinensis]|uniref:G-protein coupled receptors family 1 profile domain-containing protein n=1 Tax=Ranatra chinensis TaxID=642074 RepID=A0ABD0ZF24_9HEMI